jgi:hypothetical protein
MHRLLRRLAADDRGDIAIIQAVAVLLVIACAVLLN